MKPISLVIDGINSFYDRQEIDLRFDGLFCICGDTGSGKTTILECIIIALYGMGKRSNSTSDYINLRRDKAEIRLTFEITVEGSRKTFEVARTFYREGTGKAKAKLVNLTDGITVAEQLTAVNEKLVELIGLTCEDFTQVVILEQGKFNKFLTASKRERNDTVGNLFKLNKYKGLGSKFSERRNLCKNELDNIKKRLDELKDVTLAAITETERVIKADKKRVEQLEKEDLVLGDEVAALEEIKRIYVKCQDAEKKLNDERQKLAAFGAALDTLKKEFDALNARFKIVGEEKIKSELAMERAKDFDSLNEQLRRRNEMLSSLRTQWKDISGKLKEAESDLLASEKQEKELSTKLSESLETIFSIAKVGEKSEYFDVFDIKIKAENLLDKLDAEQKNYEEIDKKVTSLREKAHVESQNIVAAMQKCKRIKDKIDDLTAEVDRLTALQKEKERMDAARHIREGLAEGDICPVCGGIVHGKVELHIGKDVPLEKKKEELALAQKEFITLENNRYSFSTRYEEVNKALDEANSSLLSSSERLSKLREIVIVPDKIDSLRNLTKTACDTQTELTKVSGNVMLNRHRKETITDKLNEVYARGEKESEETEKLKAVIAERFNADEMAQNGAKSAKIVAEYNELSLKIADDENRIATLTSSVAKLEASVHMLENEVKNKPTFDEALLASKTDLLKSNKLERERLIAKIAAGEKELEVKKFQLERKRDLEAEKSKKSKLYDIYAQIFELVKGEKFIEYIAEEYILQFTNAASEVLSDITGGKYTLEYNRYNDGCFYVIDFLSEGKDRKVGTLSGGETFLASLALAIAISRDIARYKSYEFFFLDEGFGTLDTASIDMVVAALEKLSADTLVGVITHRSELTDAIFDKLTVTPADGSRGSIVTRAD